jgi:arylsulfatase A-like enzyme
MNSRINRRNFIRACGAGIAASALPSFALSARGKDKPNIVFIFIDDMGYGDLSCTGNKDVRTVNIDRLAEQGTMFEQFYVNYPICSPSRVAITTGQYPARHRINSFLAAKIKNRHRNMADFLDPGVTTLAGTLKSNGYATGHFGKWHMGGGRDVTEAPEPKAYGFDESFVDSFEGMGPGQHHKDMPKSVSTDIYVDKALDFLDRNKNKPFYIQLWPNDVHDPHLPKEELLKKYEKFSSNPYLQNFYAVLDNIDTQIGRLIDKIDSLGLAEETLIILTSDNGATDWPKYYQQGFTPPGSSGPFRGRKWSLYEGGIHMPFIIRWKGKVPAGKVNRKSVTAAFDLFPTICSLADIAIPADLDGENMSQAFLGKEQIRTKPIMWEYRRDYAYLRPGNPDFISPNLAIREGKWKLLINYDAKGAELYDLEADIGETTNLAEKEPQITERLKRMVFKWRASLP